MRSGDVVLAIGPSDSAVILALLRRAEAWGATTIWVGVGQQPAPHTATHLIWTDEDSEPAASSAPHDGRLVLLYHVLWELTHVCVEHPGLLTPTAATDCSDDGVCITCSDEGRLGEVIVADASGRARVRTARGIEVIDTTIVSAVAPGDLVLIHAGAAIAEIS